MKKGLLMTVSVLMIGTMILTGCGTEKEETKVETGKVSESTADNGEAGETEASGGASGSITVVSRDCLLYTSRCV